MHMYIWKGGVKPSRFFCSQMAGSSEPPPPPPPLPLSRTAQAFPLFLCLWHTALRPEDSEVQGYWKWFPPLALRFRLSRYAFIIIRNGRERASSSFSQHRVKSLSVSWSLSSSSEFYIIYENFLTLTLPPVVSSYAAFELDISSASRQHSSGFFSVSPFSRFSYT